MVNIAEPNIFDILIRAVFNIKVVSPLENKDYSEAHFLSHLLELFHFLADVLRIRVSLFACFGDLIVPKFERLRLTEARQK